MNLENLWITKIFNLSSKFWKLRQKRQCTWHYGKWQYPFLLQIHNLFTTVSIEKCPIPHRFIFTKMISLWFIWVAILVCWLEFSDIIKLLIKMLTRTDCKSKFLALKIKNVKIVGISNWIMFRTCPACFHLLSDTLRSPPFFVVSVICIEAIPHLNALCYWFCPHITLSSAIF